MEPARRADESDPLALLVFHLGVSSWKLQAAVENNHEFHEFHEFHKLYELFFISRGAAWRHETFPEG